MKTLMSFLILLTLTACATPPQWLANMYDTNDPCQTGQFSESERQRLGRPVGYQAPSWCGASSGKTYVTRDYYTNRPLTTTRAQQ